MMDYMRECHWFRVAHNVDKQLLFIPRCGITKASCSTDKCPADFGEWGAWRAGIAVVEEAAQHADEMGNLKRISRAINACGAVGWSP